VFIEHADNKTGGATSIKLGTGIHPTGLWLFYVDVSVGFAGVFHSVYRRSGPITRSTGNMGYRSAVEKAGVEWPRAREVEAAFS